jgi:hypothetical protein
MTDLSRLTVDPNAAQPIMAPAPLQTTVLGVAVGDLTTEPCICAVRYSNSLLSPGDPMFGEEPVFETHYAALGAERLPVDSSYPRIAARVNLLARRLYAKDSTGDYHVVVDAAGVGRPLVAAIRDSIIPTVHVTSATVVTSDVGDLSTLWRTETRLGWSYLLSRLQAILQGRRLSGLDPELMDAVMAYSADSIPSADPVRALALACCSEYQPVRYLMQPDTLPSPRL